MYQIILSNQAKKSLKRLDKRYLVKVSQSIDVLAVNPFLGEKMSGEFQGCFRIKIPPVRIIYQPDVKRKIVWVQAIGQRQGIYKN